ncbi:MAG: sulfatase [Chloroflexi bacterium]|nr:sulfatase [Chloroflexota bacterium]
MSPTISRREFLRLAALSPLIASPPVRSSLQTASSKQNVLFLVFDTLSARHISLYGYARDTMPNLTHFAAKATVFHNHYSAGSFTSPSTGSLLTGVYPSTHRAFQAIATTIPQFRDSNFFSLFQQAGYHTLSFSQNLLVNVLVDDFLKWVVQYVPADAFALASKEFSDDVFRRDYGIAVQAERSYLSPLGGYSNSLFLSLLSQFFGRRTLNSIPSEIRQAFPRGLPQNHDLYYLLEDLMDWAIGYIPSMPQPYAAYLHIMPPHDPYNPRQDFIGAFADQPALVPEKPSHFFSDGRAQAFLDEKREEYDEYIAYVDAEFGRLVNSLDQQGALENTWVVFTSDHGELFERGIYRHITPVLYESLIRVPLLIRAPGQLARQDVQSLTSSIDILPTLIDQLKIQDQTSREGRVLPPWLAPDSNRTVFAVEAKSNAKRGPINHGTIAALQSGKKLVHYFGYGGYESEHEFYDLENDPEELANRYDPLDPDVQKLSKKIETMRR